MSKAWWWMELGALVLLLGLRYNVGGDTLGYTYDYPSNPTLNDLINHGFSYDRKQPLWLLLQALCKLVSPEFYFFQFVHAIIVNSIFFWFFRKYCSRPFLMVAVFFVLHFAYYNMETMRQTLSVCCFLLSIPYLQKKKNLPYFALCLIAFGFHVAGAILFLIPFVYESFTKRNVIINTFVLVVVFIIMARTEMVSSMIESLNVATILLTFDFYSERYGNMNNLIYDLIFKFTIPFFYLFTHKERDKFYTGMTALYVLTLGMGASITFFWRVTDFFVIPFYVVLINDLDTSLLIKKVKITIKEVSLIFVVLMVLITRWSYYNYDYSKTRGVRDAYFYNLYIPYHSIFDPEDEPLRESIYWGEAAPLYRN